MSIGAERGDHYVMERAVTRFGPATYDACRDFRESDPDRTVDWCIVDARQRAQILQAAQEAAWAKGMAWIEP